MTHPDRIIQIHHNGREIPFRCNDYHLLSEMESEGAKLGIGATWYEHWLLDAMAGMFRGIGGTWLDIGANCGNHSLYWAVEGLADRIIAFEPWFETHEILAQNTKEYPAIERYMVAVGAAHSMVSMRIPEADDASMGGASVVRPGSGHEVNMITVDFLTLSDVRVMKIDVEGFEYQVLLGAMRTIEKSKPEIFVEIWGEELLSEIAGLLDPIGYELKERYCHAPVYHFSTRADIPATYVKPEIIP